MSSDILKTQHNVLHLRLVLNFLTFYRDTVEIEGILIVDGQKIVRKYFEFTKIVYRAESSNARLRTRTSEL